MSAQPIPPAKAPAQDLAKAPAQNLALPPWPALEGPKGGGRQASLPGKLTAFQAVWGKAHAAASDYRWLAATPPFDPRETRLESHISCGREDDPIPFPAWQTRRGSYFAVGARLSRSIDAAKRSGFLEKQVLLWVRPAEVPAALGALLLLPKASSLTDEAWWKRQGEVDWTDPEAMLSLPPAEGKLEIPVSLEELEDAIEKGRRDLARVLSEETLGRFYGDLLAGRRPTLLDQLTEPLSPQALGALLLPLPRSLADDLSLTGWLPTARPEEGDLGRNWSAVACGEQASPARNPAGKGKNGAGKNSPGEEELQRGTALARILLSAPDTPRSREPGAGAKPERNGFRLALWGPSSAGKTVLLAQLYDQAFQQQSEWKVWPTQEASAFVNDMRQRLRLENRFPVATGLKATQPLSFTFEKEGRDGAPGVRAHLDLEDRAGGLYEQLDEEATRALTAAEGLVLLFDPQRGGAALDLEVRRTLDFLHVHRQANGGAAGADPRPMAFCLSKADLLIRTPEDLERAQKDPDAFVRDRLNRDLAPELLRYIRIHCARYRLFPISAVGVRLGWGAVEPVVFYDDGLQPRLATGGHSFNLLEPFTWVLDQLAGGA